MVKILLSALNHPWLIEPNAADRYSIALDNFLTGKTSSITDDGDDDKPLVEFAWKADAKGKRIASIDDAISDGVAVINLRGAVM